MEWSQVSTATKILAILVSVLAVGGALGVFLWGRIPGFGPKKKE